MADSASGGGRRRSRLHRRCKAAAATTDSGCVANPVRSCCAAADVCWAKKRIAQSRSRYCGVRVLRVSRSAFSFDQILKSSRLLWPPQDEHRPLVLHRKRLLSMSRSLTAPEVLPAHELPGQGHDALFRVTPGESSTSAPQDRNATQPMPARSVRRMSAPNA